MISVARALGLGALSIALLQGVASAANPADPAGSELDRCLGEQGLVRLARVMDPAGDLVFARVTEDREGRPTRVRALAPASMRLANVFELAAGTAANGEAEFSIGSDFGMGRLCSPVDLPQTEIDAERQVIVAAGLNYAAHAEEAGGGEVFLFPKPSAPTSAYASVHPPSGVTLLDYEIELGIVLLEDIDLSALPSEAELLRKTALFVSNDISDREPIIREKAWSGPGTGFVTGKGQPTFLPAGPWLVRGDDMARALEACGANGLGLRLWVDGGEGPELRQSSDTSLMILEPLEILAQLGEEISERGLRTSMPVSFDGGEERFYPLAVGAERPRLSQGSLLLTGTPDGVALSSPSPLPLVLRGMLRLRSPFAQFAAEEKQAVADGERGRYLAENDRVIARIDGLGVQDFGIAAAGSSPELDPCDGGGIGSR